MRYVILFLMLFFVMGVAVADNTPVEKQPININSYCIIMDIEPLYDYFEISLYYPIFSKIVDFQNMKVGL